MKQFGIQIRKDWNDSTPWKKAEYLAASLILSPFILVGGLVTGIIFGMIYLCTFPFGSRV